MSQPLETTVTLTNGKVGFTGVCRDNPPVAFDYTPPLGDGRGYTPLELLLMSLAACSGTTVVALLRKMRKTVAGFSVSARGIRRETHPTVFETITLDFVLHSPDAGDAEMERAIRLTEESYCPVWAMIRGGVAVTTTHRIVPVPPAPDA